MPLFIDTDVFVDALRGVAVAKNFFSKCIGTNEPVYFSAITEAELLSGNSCNNPETREVVIHLLSAFAKIHVDNMIAQRAGVLRRSANIALPDALIAASAMITESILYTKNTKDFSGIVGLITRKPY